MNLESAITNKRLKMNITMPRLLSKVDITLRRLFWLSSYTSSLQETDDGLFNRSRECTKRPFLVLKDNLKKRNKRMANYSRIL